MDDVAGYVQSARLAGFDAIRMISLKNFSYTYPSAEQPALRDLSLEIPEGQFCGVVGPNGAGKSTLCFALSGFVPQFFRGKTGGSLRMASQDVLRTPLGELAGQVGLVFQNPFNQISGARFSVRDEIAFGLENLGLPREEIVRRVDGVLKDLDLIELAERSPFALSGGQQQRVAIASILAMQPRVLVLDEPTSQLDPKSTEEIFKILNIIAERKVATVVLVEHKLEWIATFAERVIVMDAGQLVLDGAPKEVLVSQELVRLGVSRTQYTEAALLTSKNKRDKPVTLDEARRFFT
jgi:energy-coupling factor transport system ATP-binding protein